MNWILGLILFINATTSQRKEGTNNNDFDYHNIIKFCLYTITKATKLTVARYRIMDEVSFSSQYIHMWQNRQKKTMHSIHRPFVLLSYQQILLSSSSSTLFLRARKLTYLSFFTWAQCSLLVLPILGELPLSCHYINQGAERQLYNRGVRGRLLPYLRDVFLVCILFQPFTLPKACLSLSITN